MTYYIINEFCIIITILQPLIMFSINLDFFLVITLKYYMHIYMFAFSILIIILTLIMDSTTIIKKHAQIVEHAHAK